MILDDQFGIYIRRISPDTYILEDKSFQKKILLYPIRAAEHRSLLGATLKRQLGRIVA